MHILDIYINLFMPKLKSDKIRYHSYIKEFGANVFFYYFYYFIIIIIIIIVQVTNACREMHCLHSTILIGHNLYASYICY